MSCELTSWLEQKQGSENFKPGLERVRKVVETLKLSAKTIITIGGTNGKGQTSRLLFEGLKAQHSTSLWTSPHIKSITERFTNNKGNIRQEELKKIFEKVEALSIKLKVKLSFYEFLFICFLDFAKESDILVLEVGLGGRLDAVNVLDADIFVLTSISRDHQEYLGPRFDQILKEKSGILRTSQNVYSALELNYTRSLFKTLTLAKKCKHLDLFEQQLLTKKDSFTKRNSELAHIVLEKEFGLTMVQSKAVSDVYPFQKFSWPSANASKRVLNTFIIAPSHNIDGVRKCIQLMSRTEYTVTHICLFLSKRSIEDAKTILKILFGHYNKATKIVICHFNHFKAMEIEKLSQLACQYDTKIICDYKKFFKNRSESTTLCLGSNYIVGELSEYLHQLCQGPS